MSTSSDLNVFRIAARQEGLVTVTQAQAAGLTARATRRRVEMGALITVTRGLLSVPGWPDSTRRRLFIGTLALDGAATSRSSAGVINDMPLLEAHGPTVTCRKGLARALPGVQVHQSRLFGPSDITVVDGLAVTTPARTLVDVAPAFGWSRYHHLLDRCLHANRPSLPEFIACYSALTRRGRHGAAKITNYLLERTAPPVHDLSEFEWMFEQLLISRGFRLPIRQFRPPWYDGWRGVADYGLPAHKLIIELDGRSFHAIMQAFREDRRRDRLARQHGWTPFRYAYEEVRYRPDDVIDELRPFLGPGSVVAA